MVRIFYAGFDDVAEILMAKGASLESVDEKGYTALHYLAEGGFLNTIKLMINKKKDKNGQLDKEARQQISFFNLISQIVITNLNN